MLTEYRIIAHTIGYESRDELAGRSRKLSQAEDRARQVVDTMKQEGKTGYVVIRDHIQRAIAQTYFVTGHQDMDDESEKHDTSEDSASTESQCAEVGTSRAADVHRATAG